MNSIFIAKNYFQKLLNSASEFYDYLQQQKLYQAINLLAPVVWKYNWTLKLLQFFSNIPQFWIQWDIQIYSYIYDSFKFLKLFRSFFCRDFNSNDSFCNSQHFLLLQNTYYKITINPYSFLRRVLWSDQQITFNSKDSLSYNCPFSHLYPPTIQLTYMAITTECYGYFKINFLIDQFMN